MNESADRHDFLKRASPFDGLESEQLSTLAKRLTELDVSSGDVIVREGDSAAGCFLVRSGEVEVVQREDGRDRTVARLGAGALFGEAALLTDSPRNATVRAVKETKLLVVKRADFLEVLSWDKAVGPALFELLSLRDKPCRRDGIISQGYDAQDGEKLTILKDPIRGKYYRLSAVGKFIWDRLDGRHNLKDLSLECLQELGLFSPHSVAEIVGGLASAGFAESRVSKASKYLPVPPRLKRLWTRLEALLRRRTVIGGVDAACARWYRRLGLKHAYSRAGQFFMALVAAMGGLAFLFRALELRRLPPCFQTPEHLLCAGLFAVVFIVLSHDAAHVFTTKFFGREVLGLGVGWHWFSPILYVDTSDMWPAPPRQRIAVHLAGIYVNLFFAGLAALLSLLLAESSVWLGRALLFCALSYAIALFNLLPFLESDGYYALQDLRELAAAAPRS
ncbi:MAG: cyclic nucleotide-binding domain-containing protein [Elusimicrobia bacterium]|nr:cyclic nucleotide-binding domain-containing protein [Elusimicrobiota bacterium]